MKWSKSFLFILSLPHVSSNHTLNIITQRCCCSITKLCPTLCNPMDCRTLGFSALHYLPEIAQTPVCWLGDAIQSSHPCHSLLLLPSIFPSIRVFSNGLTLPSGGQSIGASALAPVLPVNIQYWSPLGWTGWISLLSKGLSNFLQHHNLKASILQCSAFFMVQLSHPYMTTGKTISLTIRTFVGKGASVF